MKIKNSNKNEFYLDLVRYTFDHLFDTRKKELVIYLETIDEKRIMSSLLKHAFTFKETARGDYLQINFSSEGLLAQFVSKREAISFSSYVRMLYKYAQEEDKKIEHLTRSKIFENIIKSGFSRLGIRKNSSIYSS